MQRLVFFVEGKYFFPSNLPKVTYGKKILQPFKKKKWKRYKPTYWQRSNC